MQWLLLLQLPGSVVVGHGLGCFTACGNLSRPGIEPMSPVLAGGFLIAGPPGTSLGQIFHDVVYCQYWASQLALVVKNHPANAGDIRDVGSVPGLGRSPGGGLGQVTHSSILAWRIPLTEEPGGLQSIGSQREELDMTEVT